MASEFIISQKLINRNYISYKYLSISADAVIIKSFIKNIIERIIIEYGKVKRIIFKNRLSHSFIFKNN